MEYGDHREELCSAVLQHGILRIADASSAGTDQGNPEGTAEETNPKTKRPDRSRGAKCSPTKKKSVLGRTGTHFSTGGILL